jgi:hypothetical protein
MVGGFGPQLSYIPYDHRSMHTRTVTMPLTKKGRKIKSAMSKEYGKKKGARVFYASQNKGTIKGTHKRKK